MPFSKDLLFSQPDLIANSFADIYDMKNQGVLNDVVIQVGDRTFPAHRIILAAGIPYFKAMFSSGLMENYKKEIELKELDPTAVESLINFAYTKMIQITSENAQSILVASQYLQITSVRDSCCEFLSKMLNSENVLDVRELADSLNCLDLFDKCDCFIRENFDAFSQTSEFLSLSFPLLNKLIRRHDLRVGSEERVFKAVLSWVKSDSDERGALLPELLAGVRMTHLTPRFLVQEASKERLIRESFLCRDLLEEAKDYHLLPEERTTSSCSFITEERCYEPRCYIYAVCCSRSTGLTILKYVSKTGEWSTLLRDEKRLNVDHVLALGSQIYVFQPGQDLEAFNPKTQEWSSCGQLPQISRPVKYAVSYDNKIYWFNNNRNWPDSLYSFDPRQNRWYSERRASEFTDANIFSSESGIFILGYCSFESNFHTSFANEDYRGGGRRVNLIYEPQRNVSIDISDMCINDIGYGCACFEDEIYVCGGYRLMNVAPLPAQPIRIPSKSVLAYNLIKKKWRTCNEMNFERKMFNLIPYDKKLYAIGGATYNGGLTNTVEYYDPVTDEWTSTGSLPSSDDYSLIQGVVVSD